MNCTQVLKEVPYSLQSERSFGNVLQHLNAIILMVTIWFNPLQKTAY